MSDLYVGWRVTEYVNTWCMFADCAEEQSQWNLTDPTPGMLRELKLTPELVLYSEVYRSLIEYHFAMCRKCNTEDVVIAWDSPDREVPIIIGRGKWAAIKHAKKDLLN